MKRESKTLLLEGLLYLAALFVTTVLFLVCKPLLPVLRNGVIAQAIMAAGLSACVGVAAYMAMTKRLTARRFIFLLLLAGYLLRVGYMLYTPAATRQQDTYTKNFDGHEAYAWTIFSTGKLPTSNVYQFYHPPFNALVQAGFMKVFEGFTKGVSAIFGLGDYFPSAFQYAAPDYIEDEWRYYLYSSCQILSVLYSFAAAVVLVKTVWLFSFSQRTKLMLSVFVVLYPRQIQFSGMLNNDGLAYLLGVIALYYAVKWQKQGKKWRDILLCGLAVGLGMMTKLSSATVCLPIAGVFLYEFFKRVKKREEALSWGKIVAQYGCFLLLCAPLGLWFQVYAGVRFSQPFGFVFSNLNDKLYTGDHSLFSRFIFAFDFSEYFGSIYCRPFEGNYYLFNYALRSSIFGEFRYWQGEGFAVAAILSAYLSAAALAVSLGYVVVACIRTRGREESLLRKVKIPFIELLFVLLLVLSQVLSEVYFYLQMPYGCTMDFRYIMPLILGMALTLGCVRELLLAKGSKTALILHKITTLSVGIFLTVSALFYCVCI